MGVLREKKEASWKARKLADTLNRWILDDRLMGGEESVDNSASSR